MAVSGIKVADNVKEQIDLVSKKKKPACVFKISKDEKQIELDEDFVIDPKEKRPFHKVLEYFKPDNCRYGLVDVKFKDTEGKKQNQMVCINWASDCATIKHRMMATSSFDALKQQCPSVKLFLQMNDDSQKNSNFVLDKAAGKGAKACRFEKRKYAIDKRSHDYVSDGDDSEESD
uniref:Cofilin n=1 Tax=Phallusia mammillata TaxID=59560 RepID=A0A6F9D9D1_9ASCI|nr:cofilin [Phallusia mammillata]